ncbi:EamA family transporter [Vibrio sp. OCN044]|uniref:EamA family transporter n=1 Tax=Vibrio tetraodonis subsp. pristinus TaxID=2695891 RepID=A0A6L8LWK9_9VIBR|nr:EamA family transporter [Vibrio tetraodonis]MYM60494.1 EamA family transporter [Vibrio tetraodonis subsp. pristinus]
MKLKDISLALLVIVIWGVNFSIIKIGLEELPPLLFSALRFTIVAIPAVFFVPFPKTSVWNVLGVGLFLGVLKFGFLFFAMDADASADLSSLLLQSQVFFTIGLSILLFKEKINQGQIIGILVATIGFSLFFIETSTNITLLGLVLILMAAFFWAISNIIMKRTKGVNLLHFMIWVCLIPPLPLLAISYYTETPIELVMSASTTTWAALIYVSYASTMVAFAIWGWLLRKYEAVSVTPFALLIPVVGIITSSFILQERLSNIEKTGTVLIMFGLIFCVFYNKLFDGLKVKSFTS